MGSDDARLVEQARAGSREAVTGLFRRHWLTVWQVTYAVLGTREAADDAAQEAMIRAFASLDRFDESRPLGPWLKRIAFNRAIDDVRRRRASTYSEQYHGEEFSDAAGEAPELSANGPIAAAVAALAPERRVIIVLHYWLDHTRDEIAEILDLPPGTVASRLGRALTELRQLLEEEHVR